MIKTLTLILNNECNLNCPHCYNIQRYSKLDTSYILEKIKEEKPKVVNLFGGEPFLQKNLSQIEEILFHCSMRKILVTASTNLTFPLTHIHCGIIKNLAGLATSYNIKRWPNENLKQLWKDNCFTVIENLNYNLWCLLTLDSDLINSDPIAIYKEIKDIPFKKLRLEPYIGIKMKPNNADIDEWLCKWYDLNPTNYLFDEIRLKLKGKQSEDLFNHNCHLHTKVLHPSGKITCCPLSTIDIKDNNSKEVNYRKINEKCKCCKWYSICQGVCPLLIEDKTGCQGYPKLYEKINNESI